MKLKILAIIFVCFVVSGCLIQTHSSEESKYKVYKSLKKALKNKSDVKVLVLIHKELNEFPMEILELTNLKVLNLTHNKISKIPKEIRKLKNLESLILARNKLNGMPYEITEMKKLKKINLIFNELYDEDVKFIKEALPECRVFTEVIL